MGLREKKAQKVREAIYDAMLTLAERDGYDAATLEQVADRAEVGISTVYRYFANKDAILLDPIESNVSGLADLCRTRPDDEDVTVSLGWIVHAILDVGPEYLARMRRLRAQLDRAPGPRARLWDILQRERTLLEDAIAERSGRDPLWNAAAAHLTIMIITMAHDHDRDSFDETTPADYADRIIATLHGTGNPLPVRPRQQGNQ
ncbi:MAG TPA: helix-turn-helix domain-containing protein [Pseudonocardiaceae bacterium]|jgi:AcrR family transcriptional regulator|nr:helix-turn-helix domain-containing protein [Pseudonocardiaceae bacterium]